MLCMLLMQLFMTLQLCVDFGFVTSMTGQHLLKTNNTLLNLSPMLMVLLGLWLPL